MIELAQLFQDVEAAVIQHEPAIEAIEEKADDTHKNVQNAEDKLGGAVEKARSRRRKQWYCLGIVSMFYPPSIGFRVGDRWSSYGFLAVLILGYLSPPHYHCGCHCSCGDTSQQKDLVLRKVYLRNCINLYYFMVQVAPRKEGDVNVSQPGKSLSQSRKKIKKKWRGRWGQAYSSEILRIFQKILSLIRYNDLIFFVFFVVFLSSSAAFHSLGSPHFH